MARLSLWLPPFSPDYSGAAAVLFDLKTVTAMHDGSGCTGNYTGYDEPRWYGSKSGIYCSGLREIDAVLGNDEKLIDKMCRAAEDIRPDLMALIGSPVPMVIGSDMSGIAKELENRTGIASIGVDTTGTAYYDMGAYWMAVNLLKRFSELREPVKNQVNILGALPMDFYKGEAIQIFKETLENRGYKVGITFAMDYYLEQLKNIRSAQVNIAVSRFGYLVAVYMEKEYGIPYLCGFPAGRNSFEDWFQRLKCVIEKGQSEIFGIEEKIQSKQKKREISVLVIGEQVIGNGIRTGLQYEFGFENITVGCLYGQERKLSWQRDRNLSDERSILEEINSGKYEIVIADPFMKKLVRRREISFIPYSQYAVSSKLGIQDQAVIFGAKFNQWFQEKEVNYEAV